MSSWVARKDCGNSLFRVSGSINTQSPDINNGTPITTIGAGSHIFVTCPKNGVQIQNARDTIDENPTASDLRLVGYNSLVIKYTSEKPEKKMLFYFFALKYILLKRDTAQNALQWEWGFASFENGSCNNGIC